MKRCIVREAFLLILTFGTVANGFGQSDGLAREPVRTPYYGAGGSTLIFLLTEPEVPQELGLNDETSRELLASLQAIEPGHMAFQTAEEKRQVREKYQETMRKSDAAIEQALTEEQYRRFRQLDLQRLGSRMLLRAEIAQQLALTAEQQEKLEAIKAQFRVEDLASRNGAASGTPQPKDDAVIDRRQKYEADLLAVLTPDQLQRWNEMSGVKFEIPKTFGGTTWQFLLIPEVRKEIHLSDEDAMKLSETFATIRKEGFADVMRINPANQAGGPGANPGRQSQQIIDAVRDSLTTAQWNRLQELILQERGVEVFAQHEVAKTLGLSRDQQDQVRAITAEFRRIRTQDPAASANPGNLRTVRQKVQSDLFDLLTADQKKLWEEMQGKKVDPQIFRRPSNAPGGSIRDSIQKN